MNRRIVIGAAALVGLITVFVVLRNGGVEVTVAPVAPDTLSVGIPAEGRTRARDRFTVTAPITGRLTRLDVRVGDTVRAGQLLGRLFPAPQDPRVVATVQAEVSAAQARYLDAESRVREAELQAIQAEREAERRRPLVEMGAITRESLEQAELQATVARERLESARAGLASAEAALEGARARLLGDDASGREVEPVDVLAPVAGRVEQVPDESERVVTAGSPIVYLADAGGLEVVLDILSEDAVQVHAGDRMVIRGWGGEGTLHGSVRTVTLVGYTKISALGVEEQRRSAPGTVSRERSWSGAVRMCSRSRRAPCSGPATAGKRSSSRMDGPAFAKWWSDTATIRRPRSSRVSGRVSAWWCSHPKRWAKGHPCGSWPTALRSSGRP